jgi:predicted nucleic acid-binding Zn ribbon protein
VPYRVLVCPKCMQWVDVVDVPTDGLDLRCPECQAPLTSPTSAGSSWGITTGDEVPKVESTGIG